MGDPFYSLPNHMIRNTKPVLLSDKDGPFTYEYIALVAIPGIKLPPDAPNNVLLCEFPELGSEAFLTNDWDSNCFHIDRCNALGGLLLSAFRGKSRFVKLSSILHKISIQIFGAEKLFQTRLERERKRARDRRHKEHGGSGCYLVYRASGNALEEVRMHATRKFGNIGFGIDAYSIQPYREYHQRAIHSSMTAISLALVDINGSPETHFLVDGVFLRGQNKFSLYSRTVTMGAVSLVTTQLQNDDNLNRAKSYIPNMVEDSQFETPLCQDSCRVHIIEKKSNRGRQESEKCRITVKSSKSKWDER